MKKIILLFAIFTSIMTFGQQVVSQSQETRSNDLYFGVSQSGYHLGTNVPISAKLGAWGTTSTFNYNAAGVIFNRWLGSGTNFTTAYVGQAYNNLGQVGLSFDVSNTNSKNVKPIRRMFINNSGNVGIGTAAPDQKLTVKGKIHTQEIIVDLQGAVAPDYVFEKDYKLKSLKEIEDYINENKHLPEIPSAKTMEKEGVYLKEMNLLLLKKVEELTLHTIGQEKDLNKLQNELAELKKKVNQLIFNKNN